MIFDTVTHSVAMNITVIEPTNETSKVFFKTTKLSRRLGQLRPPSALERRIEIGIKKPKLTGNRQIKQQKKALVPFKSSISGLLCFLLVSLNRLPDRDFISRINNVIMKIKLKVAN